MFYVLDARFRIGGDSTIQMPLLFIQMTKQILINMRWLRLVYVRIAIIITKQEFLNKGIILGGRNCG